MQDEAIAEKLVATLEGVARYKFVLFEYRQSMKSLREKLGGMAPKASSEPTSVTVDPDDGDGQKMS